MTYPPGVAVLLCDIIDKCRDQPPTNWPKSAYELIMREDLASQTLNIHSDNKEERKIINVEKLIDWNDANETDNNIVKDGMENLDDEVGINYY